MKQGQTVRYSLIKTVVNDANNEGMSLLKHAYEQVFVLYKELKETLSPKEYSKLYDEITHTSAFNNIGEHVITVQVLIKMQMD